MPKQTGYTVLARRYRPVTFDEVIGQEHVSKTLTNAIAENHVGHAYLFCGPRGVGKTTMARLFAKALNCVKGPTRTPCNDCEICRAVHEGTDVDVIEMDAASNRGVDDARSLREALRYAPLRARAKIYIIDESHMLTKDAFNTLLKSLEEPPPHVKFIFATTEPHKMPDTILSRCQRFDFRRVTSADIVRRLRQVAEGEKLDISDKVLAVVARAAHGSMRDAESLLDQLISFKTSGISEDDAAAVLGEAGGTRLSELMKAVQSGEPGSVFTSLATLFAAGLDTGAFTDQLLEQFRALLAIKVCGKNAEVVDLPEADMAEAESQAGGFTVDALLYSIQILLEARRRIREGANPRLVLELALVRTARSRDLVTLPEALRMSAAPSASVAAAAPAATVPPPPTPAPAAPAPAPAAFSGVPSDLREAQAAWPRVAAAMKEKSVLISALLAQGSIVRLAGDTLSFGLPAQFTKFHCEQLEKNRAAIEAAVQAVFGRKLSLKVSLEAGGPGDGAARRPPPPTDAADDPGVRKILEAFGGSKVVSIE